MAEAARAAGVAIVGGDTKVVEHGKTDRTVHHHHRPRSARCRASRSVAGSVRPGDKVLLSGPIGDHGITILLARGELDLEADLRSDTRSVFPLVEALVGSGRPGHPLDARSHARRRRHLAQRAGARLRVSAIHLFEEADPGARRSARRLRAARPRPAAHRQRRPVPRRGRAGAGRPRARSAPRRSRWRRGGDHRRSPRRARGARCWSRPDTAAAGSWTCSSAIRCRESARSRP